MPMDRKRRRGSWPPERTWPLARAGEAAQVLAQRVGVTPREIIPPEFHGDKKELEAWLPRLGQELDVDLRPVGMAYGDLETSLTNVAPALLLIETSGASRILAVERASRKHLKVVDPAHSTQYMSLEHAHRLLGRRIEAKVEATVQEALSGTQLSPDRRARVRTGLIRRLAGRESTSPAWTLRVPHHAPIRRRIRQENLWGSFAAMGTLHLIQALLFVAMWWFIGRAALEQTLEPGWIAGIGGAMTSLLAAKALAGQQAGRLSLRLGAILRTHLLARSLRMPTRRLRGKGVGDLLGRVMETDAIENFTAAGGIMLMAASFELLTAGGILLFASGSRPLFALLVVWLVLASLFFVRYHTSRKQWTRHRTDLSGELIEQVLGHRTRVTQDRSQTQRERDDHELNRYGERSGPMDRAQVMLEALIPRGWMMVGVLGLTPLILEGASPSALAVSLGGLLLGARGFKTAAMAATPLSSALLGYERLRPFLEETPPDSTSSTPALPRPVEGTNNPTTLDVRSLRIARGNGRPLLDDIDLQIPPKDRLLLTGESGAGKSTLARAIAGLETSDDGLVRLGGMDQQGANPSEWRERVAYVPQFHENHLLLGSLAFNLLMGRRWPPTREDLEETVRVIQDVGLTSLVERMPGGLFHPVGETGWQLSQGERTRVFVARALLARAQVLLLDEPLSALDTVSRRQLLEALEARPESIIIIDHP